MTPQTKKAITRRCRLFSTPYIGDLLKLCRAINQFSSYTNSNTSLEFRKNYSKPKQTQFPSRNAQNAPGLIDIGALILIAKLINNGFRGGLLKSYYRNVAYGKLVTWLSSVER